MKRREFVISSSLAAMGSMIPGLNAEATGISGATETSLSTARELQNYLRSLNYVKEPSVDRIIIGNPDTKIKKVGTCWQPYFKTLKEAHKMGINVMVVHEPTFYYHWDLDRQEHFLNGIKEDGRLAYQEVIEKKKQWIEESQMVIIRSHDVMDIIKDFGMPFALGQALGYDSKNIIRSKDYYNVYKIDPDTAWNVAQKIANNLMFLDQPGVAFYGDVNRMVSSVGLGTGCICDPRQYLELGPELQIAIDDTVRTWVQTTYAEDTGDPLVVINHGTSEEMGMRLLGQHLAANFPKIEFTHLNQGCSYRWIPGK